MIPLKYPPEKLEIVKAAFTLLEALEKTHFIPGSPEMPWIQEYLELEELITKEVLIIEESILPNN